MTHSKKKAIIIGASSGMGRALAKVLAANGYELGLMAPNFDLLESLQRELPGESILKHLDLNGLDESIAILKGLVEEMGGLDLFIFSSGISIPNPNFEWPIEREIMQVNAVGFMAMANVAVHFFARQGSGHLVGISSIVGSAGGGAVPAYYASKVCMSSYLACLRERFAPLGIDVTDIRPGFVDTAMVKNRKGIFWLTSPEEAAQQIFMAIKNKKRIAYITKRWTVVAAVLKLIPARLYEWIHYHLRAKYEQGGTGATQGVKVGETIE